MEINNISKVQFNQDNIPRCPNCNLISLLQFLYQNNQPIINFQCENNHQGNILLKDYINIYNKYSLCKERCGGCGKSNTEINSHFFYCCKCYQFLCNSCILNHQKENKIIELSKYDSLCKIHSKEYNLYCMNCKKNLCIDCKIMHKFHYLIELSNFNYSKKDKNKLVEEIKNLENKIKNLDIIKENITKKINELKESIDSIIKFSKILLYTYEYEEKNCNLNYNIVQNLKNFERIINFIQINLYEKVYNKGNDYILILQNIENINPFENNFKKIYNYRHYIYYLDKLNDGRLVCCTKELNIYKKDSYKLQLSIKEHSSYINSFTELYDGRIITCSKDKTMKLIKLINEDKYEIQQTLDGHNDSVCKIIEIKKEELISISKDKTMKIWILNKDNKFEYITNINFQELLSDCNILKLNEKEFVTSSCNNKYIKFWNSNNYSNIAIINNVESSWALKNMCLLEEDILCVGGENSKGFYLIKISNHQIIKNIIGPYMIYSINKLWNNLFLCSIIDGNKNNNLIIYKYENEFLRKISEKQNAHNKDNIYSCVEMYDGIIASAGSDNLIKLWKS